ncbi:MAG: hypothetical protein AB2588_16710 [Candidatus Thiodiazotropha sp.]
MTDELAPYSSTTSYHFAAAIKRNRIPVRSGWIGDGGVLLPPVEWIRNRTMAGEVRWCPDSMRDGSLLSRLAYVATRTNIYLDYCMQHIDIITILIWHPDCIIGFFQPAFQSCGA